MTEKQLAAIEAHGRNLLAIFPHAEERDPVKLCKKLRRLEAQGAAFAMRLCNGPEFDSEEAQDAERERIVGKVNALLGNVGDNARIPIFLNGDPRGYALKIRSEWLVDQCEHNRNDIGDGLRRIHKDWGGYGIIAPEIK